MNAEPSEFGVGDFGPLEPIGGLVLANGVLERVRIGTERRGSGASQPLDSLLGEIRERACA